MEVCAGFSFLSGVFYPEAASAGMIPAAWWLFVYAVLLLQPQGFHRIFRWPSSYSSTEILIPGWKSEEFPPPKFYFSAGE